MPDPPGKGLFHTETERIVRCAYNKFLTDYTDSTDDDSLRSSLVSRKERRGAETQR